MPTMIWVPQMGLRHGARGKALFSDECKGLRYLKDACFLGPMGGARGKDIIVRYVRCVWMSKLHHDAVVCISSKWRNIARLNVLLWLRVYFVKAMVLHD